MLTNAEAIEQAVAAVPGVLGVNVRLVERRGEIEIGSVEYTGDVDDDSAVYAAIIQATPLSVMPPQPSWVTRVTPIPTALRCPRCGLFHIDRGEWATRPHRTHSCSGCQNLWRPYEHPTIGIDPAGCDAVAALIKQGVRLQSAAVLSGVGFAETYDVSLRDGAYVLFSTSRTGNHAGNAQMLIRSPDPVEAAERFLRALNGHDPRER